LFGFNLDIILNRCVHNKVPHWSRLGRLKRSVVPNSYQKNQTQQQQHQSGATNNLIIQQRIQTVCSGRLLCDVMLSAKELITKCKSYDLHDLAQHILFKGNDTPVLLDRNLDEEKQVAQYYNSSLLLMKYLGLAMTDATYIMRMCNDLQCLQLAYQITCIAGNVLSRTLVGGRSERNEFLLLHAFHDKDFILPDKTRNNYKKSKQPANKTAASQKPVKVEMKLELEDDDDEDDLLLSKINLTNITNNDETTLANKKIKPPTIGYTGGLVLEPKVGFYDRFILLLDFNSLYPSIIQEYNICFTTINRVVNDLADTDMDEYLDACIKLPGPDEKPGILPLEIRKLVDSRRQVKQLMQDKNLTPDLRMQYDIRQKALKLTANSVYGCLGFENSRFYCKPLAALITKNGRNILMKTKELVENVILIFILKISKYINLIFNFKN
jgi:DNA polymerase alpha subunit A